MSGKFEDGKKTAPAPAPAPASAPNPDTNPAVPASLPVSARVPTPALVSARAPRMETGAVVGAGMDLEVGSGMEMETGMEREGATLVVPPGIGTRTVRETGTGMETGSGTGRGTETDRLLSAEPEEGPTRAGEGMTVVAWVPAWDNHSDRIIT